MTDTVHILIPGPPTPWQRTRLRSNARGMVNPKKMRAYKRHVQACVQSTLMQHRIRWDMDGVYDLTLHMAFPDRRVRDDDNVEKALKDAAQGILWRTDAWTHFRRITKTMGLDRDNPRVEMTVRVVRTA